MKSVDTAFHLAATHQSSEILHLLAKVCEHTIKKIKNGAGDNALQTAVHNKNCISRSSSGSSGSTGSSKAGISGSVSISYTPSWTSMFTLL